MKENFLLSKKHSCNLPNFNIELDHDRKNDIVREFYSEMNNLIESYNDLYDPFLITFNIEKEPGCYFTNFPNKTILTHILKKTFNRLHRIYFGKLKKHTHLDFIRIGTYGSGREESCFDHYHFLMCIPNFLLPVLEKEFNLQVKQLLKGFRGEMHYKEYDGSIQNFLEYGTRYYSDSENNIPIFDGIEVEISSLRFSLTQYLDADSIKELHRKNLYFYLNKHTSAGSIFGKKLKICKTKTNSRIKEDPFSDKSMYDFRYRSMF
ncbi:hypothetical protein [Leptospira vanthielii]|uniref:Uncharacterized protein n=1 Tax=Leptospira vanthielii serovar Holland str. Waz Holland = ATCC 700522 TaxID=1218591 RepID=N1W0L9_9LEPT|nr:hypothetical protein [Leptospira vanthielii]EMY69759.1 hypothetical protein LEP1GSC199_2358 [Leptospira vanthielii serovar Holland str. Waz Holland = ATCC 700522]